MNVNPLGFDTKTGIKGFARKVVAGGAMAAATLGMGACGGSSNAPGSITGPKPQSAIEQKFLGSYLGVLAPNSNLTSAPTTISYTEAGDGTVNYAATLDTAKSTKDSLVYNVAETDTITGAVGNSTETYTIGSDGNLKVNGKAPNTTEGGVNLTITQENGYVKLHNNIRDKDDSLLKKVKTGVVGIFNPTTQVKEGEQTNVQIDGKLISLKKKAETLGEQLMDAARTRFGKSLGSEEVATKVVKNLSKMA